MKRSLFAVLAAAALAASAAAQTQPPDGNWAPFNQLAAGSEIRVQLTSGRTVRGYFQSATADSLAINATTSQERLSRQEIRRVQVKREGHRGRNTLIGLGLGAGVGLAAGAAADAGRPDDWFPNAGKAVLTPLGMLVGTVVGVAWPTGGWREIYRAR